MPAQNFEDALARVKQLAETFQANERQYLSSDYQEAEARKDFIDKFFIALGWDVNHNVQTNPYQQEVKVERTGGVSSQRRADYALYLAPNFRDVRLYVEAKKPFGEIATPDNYFQATRYGYGSKNPLVVITDFRRLHILDCRFRPDIETAIHRVVARYHYEEYGDKEVFAKIYWLLSHEAVAAGSIESYSKDLPRPRGKAVQRGLFPGAYKPVDESLLEELDSYRETLARTFKARNPLLDSETLTEITQRTLDRLVFLRFLEDKLIETPSLVDKFGSSGTAWEDFIAASRRLNGIYNGVVFKKHSVLDATNFRVDEDDFADICEKLSHVNSPYNFDAIPIHILGSIYERFLGKVIVATGRRVTVEDKLEVRKAGGVYYTPEYIVRYIVENTVGRLIEGKTPEEISQMRFADIACGSGSFLLGVYDLLLQYHGNYYNANPKKAGKGDCIDRDGRLYLSLIKKRQILLNNIYGVDLDAQAVEVCQLSLYLRLLRDETTASAHQYLMDFEHAAQLKKLLPDLSKNVVCGNSLIGSDVLDSEPFPVEEERKINPMNFEDVFPAVMKRGGFDVIVGNPPYGADFDDTEKGYIREHFVSYKYKYDSYIYFIERALSLVTKEGYVSYITPELWLKLETCAPLRSLIADNARS
jgi:adenine-specific DNA-methyltransferase